MCNQPSHHMVTLFITALTSELYGRRKAVRCRSIKVEDGRRAIVIYAGMGCIFNNSCVFLTATL